MLYSSFFFRLTMLLMIIADSFRSFEVSLLSIDLLMKITEKKPGFKRNRKLKVSCFELW